MEPKKAYGTITALGTQLGERAKDEPAVLEGVRAVESAPALREKLTQLYAGTRLEALAAAMAEHVSDADWKVWRSRLPLQAKMVVEGGKPAPGHEAGRGTGTPGGKGS